MSFLNPFGNSSKTSSSESSVSNRSISLGIGGDNSAAIIGENTGTLNVESTTPEVVDAVFNFARATTTSSANAFKDTGKVLVQGFQTALQATKTGDERNTQEFLEIGKYAAIGLAVLAAVYIYKK